MKTVTLDLKHHSDYNSNELIEMLANAVTAIASDDQNPILSEQLKNVDPTKINKVSISKNGIVTLEFED